MTAEAAANSNCYYTCQLGRIEARSLSNHKQAGPEFVPDQTKTISCRRSWCECLGPDTSAITVFTPGGEKRTTVRFSVNHILDNGW